MDGAHSSNGPTRGAAITAVAEAAWSFALAAYFLRVVLRPGLAGDADYYLAGSVILLELATATATLLVFQVARGRRPGERLVALAALLLWHGSVIGTWSFAVLADWRLFAAFWVNAAIQGLRWRRLRDRLSEDGPWRRTMFALGRLLLSGVLSQLVLMPLFSFGARILGSPHAAAYQEEEPMGLVLFAAIYFLTGTLSSLAGFAVSFRRPASALAAEEQDAGHPSTPACLAAGGAAGPLTAPPPSG